MPYIFIAISGDFWLVILGSWLVILGSWFRIVFTKVCEGRAVQDRPYIFIAISGDFWLVVRGS